MCVENVKFDFDNQVWRKNGVTVEQAENWDYPCCACQAPAEFKCFDAYFEYYKCLACQKTTRVN